MRRFLFCVALLGPAAVAGAVDGASGEPGDFYPDVYRFATAGAQMFSVHWASTFGDPWVQAGPLELALTRFAAVVGFGDRGFAIALDVVAMAAIGAVAALFVGARLRGLVLFAVGAVAAGLPGSGYTGHPAELVIAALWLLAARTAARGRVVAAAAYVGISAGFELWGLLGVTVLLVASAPTVRRLVAGAALAAAVPVLLVLPFVAAGDFRMFDFRWEALSGIPRLLVGYDHPFTWPMRLGEAVAVLAAGAACARLARKLPERVWLVPAVTVLARIALDPVRLDYYWAAPAAIMLVGAAAVAADPRDLGERLARRFPAASQAG